ncbi:Forkhead box protein J3 [Mortierella alpina]|nr:Forkhead box protein J3 [Mortierella alpina]
MDSLRQSPLPLENENGPSKGERAAGPLSPSPAASAADSGMTETTADSTFTAALGFGQVSGGGHGPVSGDSPHLAHDGASGTTAASDVVSESDLVHRSPPAIEDQDIRQKPAISYATLISQAILESTRMKLTLGDIYSWIMTNYPYYRYSSSGWQNSIRHNLSLNKAFLKLDRTQDEPGKGCFWTLHENAKELGAASTLCKKRKGSSEMNTPASIEHDASLNAAVATRSKGSMLPKLDCRASGLPPSQPQPAVESVPSPAASEDAEDVKSPRRSGRARRPPRHKEAEDYVVHHARQPSLSGLSLSTPPSSPAPFAQDPVMNPTTALARKRAGSVRMERGSFASAPLHNSGDGERSAVAGIHTSGTAVTVRSSAGNSPVPESAPSSRTAAAAVTGRCVPDAELTAIPGVVTSQRVRRPPQNLAEFVSSEDFKAAPFGCNKRTLQPSMSSSSLTGTAATAEGGRAAAKREKKRSKSEGQLWCSNSGKKATESEMDRRDSLLNGRVMKDRHDTAGAGWTSSPSNTQQQQQQQQQGQQLPASVSLSALSHSKRANQDLRCFSRSKKAQRRAECEQSALRRRIFERRRREGRREIMVASEDDWSDSDFDFLRDEEENYRLMRLRVERLQVGDHGFGRDEEDEEDEDEDEDEEASKDGRRRRNGAEEEKIKLLMDPSVINYGFDSCDGEYILDYHQGPLFNNVTWPEFSDVKEDKNDKDDKDDKDEKDHPGSSSGNGNGHGSSNKLNGDSHGDGGASIDGSDEHSSEGVAAETGVQEVDPSVVAEVISVLVGRAQQQETGPIDPLSPLTPMSPLSPLCTPNDAEPTATCMDEAVRAKEVGDMEQAWASFVTKCAPAMQDSSSASRRSPGPGSSMEMHTQGKADKGSGGAIEVPLLAETELVVAVVTAVAVESDVHMVDTAQEDAGCVRTVVKEEIEAEDFIGWSLCD